ncbi:MAG: oligosaccharide flippase family protein [Victivallaceae bacterium]|nr:oligosaccharide flippase family protein [Victivallaceae bacterium]
MTKILDFGTRLVKNTASNYLTMAVKLLSAIFLTYLLFTGLGKEFYGFWSLLWSVFIYSLLLDLGFGKAVEKYSAEASFSGDMPKFNSILSTIVASYGLMALLIITVGFIISFYLETVFQVKTDGSAHTVEYYRKVFILFTVGIALVFPTGVFPTILVGLQRTYLRNYVLIANKLIELAGVWYILRSGRSLAALVVFTASLNLLSNFAMGIMVFRFMPGLKISFRHIKLSALQYIGDFSLFTYVLTICDLIIFQTDRVVLGVMLGMSSVAMYQVATKIPQLISIASTQFQANLAPIAAILHKAGDKRTLQETMFASTRITVFICTGVFTVFIPLVRQILFVWLKVTDETTIALAYILITSMYMLIIFRDIPKHFLLMTGHHRFLTWIAVAESIANLVLSVILVKLLGAEGVAWGTLIPNAVISLFIIFPVAARHSGSTTFPYLVKVYLPIILLAAPIAVTVIFATGFIPLENWNFNLLAGIIPATGMLYLLAGWLTYVNRAEKEKLCSFLPQFIPRKLVDFIVGS